MKIIMVKYFLCALSNNIDKQLKFIYTKEGSLIMYKTNDKIIDNFMLEIGNIKLTFIIPEEKLNFSKKQNKEIYIDRHFVKKNLHLKSI